jgi:hypothetical protein
LTVRSFFSAEACALARFFSLLTAVLILFNCPVSAPRLTLPALIGVLFAAYCFRLPYDGAGAAVRGARALADAAAAIIADFGRLETSLRPSNTPIPDAII